MTLSNLGVLLCFSGVVFELVLLFVMNNLVLGTIFTFAMISILIIHEKEADRK